jgi:hypothetical protein
LFLEIRALRTISAERTKRERGPGNGKTRRTNRRVVSEKRIDAISTPSSPSFSFYLS